MLEKKVMCGKMKEAMDMADTLVLNLATLARANRLEEIGNEGLAKIFENLSLILSNAKNVFDMLGREE